MLKKIGKKLISVLLAVTLIATTFLVFDPSILVQKSKAAVDVKKLVNTVEPAINFYVPETIYLNPVIGSGSQPYSFQYFVDCDENGTLHRSATQTTGTIYFSSSVACDSVSITWEKATVDTTTVKKTSQIVKQNITGGTTSVKDGRVKVTCTYVVGGVTYHAYAYTYMYYPELDLLTGVAASYVYDASFGDEPKLAAFAFVTGVHYVGNNTSLSGDERAVSNYYDQYTTSSSKGAYGLSPLIPDWSSLASFVVGDEKAYIPNSEIYYGETTSSTSFVESGNGGVYFHNRTRAGDTDRTWGSASNAWGTLYVDTSRITNYNQIPNLRGGFICHCYYNCGDAGKLDTFQTTDGAITVTSNIDFKNGDGKGYGMTSSESLSGAVTSSNTDYTMQAHFYFKRGNSSGVHSRYDFGFRVRPVNKGALRSTYRDVIESGIQAETAKRNGWSDSTKSQWTSYYNALASALDTAGTILGKPYATASEVNSALSVLNSAKKNCDNIINANFSAGEDNDILPQVYFYVPETIYLDPSDNQTFQYFYGVETDGENIGVPTKDISLSTAQSGAGIYFAGKNCSPSRVKITVEASSVGSTSWTDTSSSRLESITFDGQKFTGSEASSTGKSYPSSSFPVSVNCTAGKISSAVTPSSYSFLRWTAEYVVDGITYEAYAYTICYAPYDQAASAAARARNTRKVKADVQSIAWIVGITGCNTNGGNKSMNQSKFNPIKGIITVPTNTQNDGGYSQDSGTYVTGSSGTGYFQNLEDGGKAERSSQAVAPLGTLTLDSTRFTNLKYVPNFKIGYLISYVSEGSDSCRQRRFGYYFSDASQIDFTPASGSTDDSGYIYFRDGNRGTYFLSDTAQESTTEKIDRSYCYPRLVYNGTWDKEITSSTTVRILGAARFGTYSNDRFSWDRANSNANNATIVPVYVTVVDKSELRSRLQNAVSLAKQQSWYDSDGYNVYQNSILSMAINLGEPSRTATSGSVNDGSLVRKSGGQMTAVYLRDTNAGPDYNGNTGAAIIGTETESKTYSFGDRGYGYYNNIPGFTAKSYSVTCGSTTKSSLPQDSDHNNFYYIRNINTTNVDWKFVYTPNTYTVTYDTNEGEYNGTTAASTSSATFQSKFTVAQIGGTIPANPTRIGCTFIGWKCSADGLTYQPGDVINWEFDEDVTFTAQWNFLDYVTFFNENYDGKSANLLNPGIEKEETIATSPAEDQHYTLTIDKQGAGAIKLNGDVAGNVTIAVMPYTFSAGTYTLSIEKLSGIIAGGGVVIDLITDDSGTTFNPRKYVDSGNSQNPSTTITLSQEEAAQVWGYKLWLRHDASVHYASYHNAVVTPRIEEGSNSEGSSVFAHTYKYNFPYENLPVPEREGYTFTGWYTAADGGELVTNESIAPYYDRTLYAHWTINSYTVTYDYSTNGGQSATKNSDIFVYNTAVDFPKATKDGWKFIGWNTDENATTGITSMIMPAKDVTLYAIYSKTLTAKFYSGLDKATSESKSTTIWNKAISGNITTPTSYASYAPAWDFAGWTKDTVANASASKYSAGSEITIYADQGTAEFYALYSQLQTLSYDVNTGVGSPETTQTTGYYNSCGVKNNGTHTVTTVVPTKEGYDFMGWYTTTDDSGTRYAAGSTYKNVEQNDTLHAVWKIRKYTITFVDSDGTTILQKGEWEHFSTPVYSGPAPTKASDAENEYPFIGWTPSIKTATESAVYVATYDTVPHEFEYVCLNDKQHKKACKNCSYEEAPVDHDIIYEEIAIGDGTGYRVSCTYCDYSFESTAIKYTVDFSSDIYINDEEKLESVCTVNQRIDETISTRYFLATIQAPLKVGLRYFVYWMDANTGEIVSSYRTYTFFVTKNCNFTPVYAYQQDYTAERNKAVISSRILGCKDNSDNTTVNLLAEHSVAKTGASIISHGILYTTDSAYSDNENLNLETAREIENVHNLVAGLSQRVLTGLFEVKINPGSDKDLWARSYVIDGNGDVHYGEAIKYFNLDELRNPTTSSDELAVLDTESFDLTVINVEDEINPPEDDTPTDVPDDTATEDAPTEEETTHSVFEKLASFFAKIIDFINKILSFFRTPEVIK